MNKTLLEILQSREDISDYVFHFTKHANAYETLQTILDGKAIKDVNNKGYICFSEAPITMLPSMFDLFERYDNPMYAPYGIGIRKEDIFNLGGRPAIYGTVEELTQLPEALKWRGVPYIPGAYDYSWLREWRVPTKEVLIDPNHVIVICKDTEEIFNLCSELEDIEVDGDVEEGCTEFLGWADGKFKRIYKGVSLEDIRTVNHMSKGDFANLINQQNIGDEESRPLGSIHYNI